MCWPLFHLCSAPVSLPFFAVCFEGYPFVNSLCCFVLFLVGVLQLQAIGIQIGMISVGCLWKMWRGKKTEQE